MDAETGFRRTARRQLSIADRRIRNSRCAAIDARRVGGRADGSRLLRDSITGSAGNSRALGEELADRVLSAGARALLERLRTS